MQGAYNLSVLGGGFSQVGMQANGGTTNRPFDLQRAAERSTAERSSRCSTSWNPSQLDYLFLRRYFDGISKSAPTPRHMTFMIHQRSPSHMS